MANANGRKKIIINPRFQYTLIGYVGAVAFGVIAVLFGANLYFFSKFHAHGVALGIPSNHVYFDLLQQQSSFMTKVFAVTALLVFVLIVTAGALISHRIAGPIYRLTKHLNALADGAPPNDVHFRNGDFFPELAQATNRHLEHQRTHGTAVKKGA